MKRFASWAAIAIALAAPVGPASTGFAQDNAQFAALEIDAGKFAPRQDHARPSALNAIFDEAIFADIESGNRVDALCVVVSAGRDGFLATTGYITRHHDDAHRTSDQPYFLGRAHMDADLPSSSGGELGP